MTKLKFGVLFMLLIIIHKKNSTRVGTIVDQYKVVNQAGVVHDIKSQ